MTATAAFAIASRLVTRVGVLRLLVLILDDGRSCRGLPFVFLDAPGRIGSVRSSAATFALELTLLRVLAASTLKAPLLLELAL